MGNSMHQIIQLKITLEHTQPAIWRRILVKNNITMLELHHINQAAMGWENCHLFEFNANGYKIGLPDKEFGPDVIEAVRVKLNDLLSEKGDTIEYLYDFGDSWEHQIKAEKFLPEDKTLKYPLCTDGELACPPEDCGGFPGFYNMLEILKNPKHREYKEMREWVGKKYNPEYFNLEAVNKELAKLKTYIRKWNKGCKK